MVSFVIACRRPNYEALHTVHYKTGLVKNKRVVPWLSNMRVVQNSVNVLQSEENDNWSVLLCLRAYRLRYKGEKNIYQALEFTQQTSISLLRNTFVKLLPHPASPETMENKSQVVVVALIDCKKGYPSCNYTPNPPPTFGSLNTRRDIGPSRLHRARHNTGGGELSHFGLALRDTGPAACWQVEAMQSKSWWGGGGGNNEKMMKSTRQTWDCQLYYKRYWIIVLYITDIDKKSNRRFIPSYQRGELEARDSYALESEIKTHWRE